MNTIKTGVVLTALVVSGCFILSGRKNPAHGPSDFRDAVKDSSDGAIDSLKSSAIGLNDPNSGIVLPAPQAAEANGESAAEMDEFFKYIGDIFNTPKAMPLSTDIGRAEMDISKAATDIATGRAGAVVYSFKLGSILNSYIDSGLSFQTPHGTKVKFSGYTASNCPDGGQSCADKERFFLILSAGPKETYFIKATEVINAVFVSGSKKVTIGGDELTVKIYAVLSDIPSSRIEITCGGGKVFTSTLKQLGDAVAAKGANIRLGKTYNLAYGNELTQGKGGARFSNNLVVILSPVGVPGFYFLNRADINASGVTYPEMEPGFGFRLTENVLEIFRLK